jgi:hypothetical protein
LVKELIDPLKAHAIPRPRKAGLAPPLQFVKVRQKLARSGLAIIPVESAEADQGAPVGRKPRVLFKAELTPVDPLSVI